LVNNFGVRGEDETEDDNLSLADCGPSHWVQRGQHSIGRGLDKEKSEWEIGGGIGGEKGVRPLQ